MAKMTHKKMDNEMMPEEGCCGSGMGHEAGCEMPGHGGGCCGKDWHRHCPGKFFIKFSAGVLMLLLAIWVGMQIWGNPWYKNIRAEFTATPYARTVTVDGDGKVTIKPDIARISLSVASTGKTVKEVTDDNIKKMNAVIAELKKLGIKSEDMQTSSYDLYPQYDYNQPIYIDSTKGMVQTPTPDKAPRIVGYSLNQTVAVKVRDLNKTDDVVDVATKAGANQVGSLMFDVDDLSVPKAAARKLAFDKARAKAVQMAGAAGVALGKVVTFSEGYTGGYPIQYANYAMRDMAVSSATPAPSTTIEPGSQEITVNVSVTYEIE